MPNKIGDNAHNSISGQDEITGWGLLGIGKENPKESSFAVLGITRMKWGDIETLVGEMVLAGGAISPQQAPFNFQGPWGFIGGNDPIFNEEAGIYGASTQRGVFGYSSKGTGVFGKSLGSHDDKDQIVGWGIRGETVNGVAAVQGQSFGSGLAGKFIGNVRVEGNINASGTIVIANGGDIRFADLSEEFDVLDAESVEAGSVMVLSDTGALKVSQTAYDRRVAGVIAGGGCYRTAITLDKGQSERNRLAVALVGKVYCKVDASPSAIEAGDLLTTSPTPGHAMKATEPAKAFGAIIGKALSRFNKGQGLIPILVALQ